MILTVQEVKALPHFRSMTDDEVKDLLDAVESLVRKYTNNNFQNRNIRFYASSDRNQLSGSYDFLNVGDTIQITESGVNDGLYVIEELADGLITVDQNMFTVVYNLVTKVEYPPAVKRGVLDLLKWKVQSADKVGIKSESLSRHSVTYYDMDANNQVMGYPVSLLGFLDMYKKARF